MIRVVHPGSGSRFITHLGSRIQGSKRHRIRIRDTEFLIIVLNAGCILYFTLSRLETGWARIWPTKSTPRRTSLFSRRRRPRSAVASQIFWASYSETKKIEIVDSFFKNMESTNKCWGSVTYSYWCGSGSGSPDPGLTNGSGSGGPKTSGSGFGSGSPTLHKHDVFLLHELTSVEDMRTSLTLSIIIWLIGEQ
jgi:hypothetical protein